MLDSTAAVAAERAGQNARQLLESVGLQAGDDEITLSVITVVELAHGVARADSKGRTEKRQRFLHELIKAVPIQPITSWYRLACRTNRRSEPRQGTTNPASGPAHRRQRAGTRL